MAEQVAKNARIASTVLKTLSNEERIIALKAVHDGLLKAKLDIFEANIKDMQAAKENNLSSALIGRLDLSKGDKFDVMLQGILDVADLEDPVGKLTLARQLDQGLNLYRVTAPVGVLLVIFEARPEVIANISALAIKSGNAAILKCGKECFHTFTIMSKIVSESLATTVVPKDAVQMIGSREDVAALLDQDKYIDLVIPRGSRELVRSIKENTKIPVLGHADGICSIYVDKDADLAMASRILADAKTNYPSGCNAAETLLIHESLKDQVTQIVKGLIDAGVVLHASESVAEVLAASLIPAAQVVPAVEGDFDKEFLSFDIAVDFTKDVNSAIQHINTHGSKHTDVIITDNKDAADKFLKSVDTAGVYWNCSSRFADGFRYGFGTEVGISTNKIHSRGPVGLEGLMIYQYQLRGEGNIAGDYLGAGGKKAFIHKDIELSSVQL